MAASITAAVRITTAAVEGTGLRITAADITAAATVAVDTTVADTVATIAEHACFRRLATGAG
jgi:hypothetical protein